MIISGFVCPVCGGKLHIVIETGLAVCEACQRTFDVEPMDVKKYSGVDVYNDDIGVRPAMWIDVGGN